MNDADEPTHAASDAAPDPTPDVASEMIAALEGAAELVDDGTFTLDAAQARKKLRERRLADRRRWILFVIEAAWTLGARLVSILVGARSVEIQFAGVNLSASDFARLYDPLGDDGDSDPRSRRAVARLGIAIETAFAVGAKSVELLAPLDSRADEPRAVRARIGPEGRPEIDEVELRINTHHLQLEFGLGFSWGELEDILVSACRWSPMWIEVDGRRVNAGLRQKYAADEAKRSQLADVLDEDGDRIGHAWLGDQDQAAEVQILTRGVFAESIRMANTQRGFVAIVDSDLERDIGEAKLRRGPELDALLERVHLVADDLHPGTLAAVQPPAALARGRAAMGVGSLIMIGFASLLIGSLLNPWAGLASLALGGALLLGRRRR